MNLIIQQALLRPPEASLSFLGSNSDTAGSTTTRSFPNSDFGPPAIDRYIFVAYKTGNSGQVVDANSCSIGGGYSPVKKFGEVTSGSANTVGFLLSYVPVGTSGTITIVTTANNDIVLLGWYRITGLNSEIPFATATDVTATSNALDGTIAIPSGGFGLGIAGHNSSAARTWSWSNMTLDFDIAVNRDSSGASWTNGDNLLRTATASSTIANPALSLASWR